jgi:hypothetical protein
MYYHHRITGINMFKTYCISSIPESLNYSRDAYSNYISYFTGKREQPTIQKGINEIFI